MIKIFTFPHKRPDFVEYQIKSFQKYLQEDFVLTVFNNAAFDADRQNYIDINRICQTYNLSVIDVQHDANVIAKYQPFERVPFFTKGFYSNANIACAYPLCWAWDKFISKETDPVCIVHSDIFLIEPIKLTHYLKEHNLCYLPQSTVMHRGTLDQYNGPEYMWEALALLDMARLPDPATLNWCCGRIPGDPQIPVDVGGQTATYLMIHPELKTMKIREEHFQDDPLCNFHPSNYLKFRLGDKTLLHYTSGSNWDHKSPEYHKNKTIWLKKMIGI